MDDVAVTDAAVDKRVRTEIGITAAVLPALLVLTGLGVSGAPLDGAVFIRYAITVAPFLGWALMARSGGHGTHMRGVMWANRVSALLVIFLWTTYFRSSIHAPNDPPQTLLVLILLSPVLCGALGGSAYAVVRGYARVTTGRW